MAIPFFGNQSDDDFKYSPFIPCEVCGLVHPLGQGGSCQGLASESSFQTDELHLPNVWKRMPNTAFGIAMGLAGHAIMWKGANKVLPEERTEVAALLFWSLSATALLVVGTAYVYKMATQFQMVRDERNNPVRVHFMNAPHLTLLMLAMSLPEQFTVNTPSTSVATILQVIWLVGFLVQLIMTQSVYETWLFSKVSNISSAAQPQFLLSIVGWFLLSVLGGGVADIQGLCGLPVPTYCLGAGIALYSIAVIAIINRLHLANTKGSPALTLLIAPPSVAVVALDGLGMEMAAAMIFGYVLVVFLLLIKIGPRIAESPPSLGAYWAYVFPLASMAGAAFQQDHEEDTRTGRSAQKVLSIFSLVFATLALWIVIARMMVHIVQSIRGLGKWGDPVILGKLRNAAEMRQKERENEHAL